MLVVAFSTAVLLALVASLVASAAWQERERQTMRATADALVEAVQYEAKEDGLSLEEAAPEAFLESSAVGYRVEVWMGERFVAANLPGANVGPPSSEGSSDWILETRSIAPGLVLLLAAPESRSAEVASVFARSLLLATPAGMGLAVLVGWLVGRRATRPLTDFTARIGALRALEPLPSLGKSESPREVLELENAFRALWQRLEETVARELEFAQNASHELRTSLTRIRLHAERARDRGLEGREEIDAQLGELERMVRLVDSLLVMSRDVASGVPLGEVVNLADVTRSAVRRVFANQRAVALEAPDEVLVSGDEDLMGIAVENLLDNARKFAPPTGRVLVTVEESGNHVRLSVTSEGAAVAERERGRIFQRFYRSPEARSSSPGHGLGLPLCRHIARLHGGDVECVSREEEDARFVLEVPSWRPTVPA
jgi:two-component system sensor histidine kinase MprB